MDNVSNDISSENNQESEFANEVRNAWSTYDQTSTEWVNPETKLDMKFATLVMRGSKLSNDEKSVLLTELGSSNPDQLDRLEQMTKGIVSFGRLLESNPDIFVQMKEQVQGDE